MKCIVGLGNPGRKYSKARHNVGFMVIDELLKRHNWKLNQGKFQGKYTLENVNGEKVMLLKPQTFMNLSGQSVRPLADYYDISPADILVIYDDLDLPAGKVRLRQTGGHGGHNGIRSVIDQLGTKDFNRVRIGIGRPEGKTPVIDYVLKPFAKEERDVVRTSIDQASDACEAWMKQPFKEVMNTFNA